VPERFADFTEISDAAAMPERPVVSVLVVTYKHEAVLADAIEGIAAQKTDFPIEIVVAEDNSPDGTRDVAIAMQRKYPHLVRVLFTPQNKGGAPNSIFGISKCRGEFIAICEGDDFWIDEDKLARQVAAMRRLPQVDLAFTRGFRFYSDGTRVPEWSYGDEERVVQAPELFASLGWIAPSASLLFRSEILKSLPPWFETSRCPDFVVILAGSVRGGAYYEPRETICYRIGHESGFTVWFDNAPLEERIAQTRIVIDHYRQACDHYGFPRRHVAHRLDDYKFTLGKLQLRAGQRAEGLRTLAGLSPLFYIRGAWRRVTRRTRGAEG
jgi:glycosyltransferase involved in cell wall biosynthesis